MFDKLGINRGRALTAVVRNEPRFDLALNQWSAEDCDME
jgi:hypothetical protein